MSEALAKARDEMKRLSMVDQELDATRARLGQVETQLTSQNARCESAESENVNLRNTLRATENAKKMLEEESERVGRDFAEMHERVLRLDDLLNAALAEHEQDKQKLSDAAGRLESSELQCQRLQREKAAMDALVRELEVKLSDAAKVRARVVELEHELNENETQYVALNTVCERLKNELVVAVDRLDATEKEMADRTDALETQAAQLSAQILDLEVEGDQKTAAVSRLEADLEVLKSEKAQLDTERMSLSKRCGDLDAYIRTQRDAQITKLKQLEALMNESRAKHEQAAKRNSELEAAVAKAEREAEEAMAQLYDVQDKLSQLEMRAHDSESAAQSQKTMYESVQSSRIQKETEMSKRIRELEAEVETMRDSLARAATDSFKAMSSLHELESKSPASSSMQRMFDGTPPLSGEVSEEAYRKLKAENAELLVMLAELEMERESIK
uniref:Uncharacterized protein n=1 Tax=Timspurckia oligopyrenoides TaxID=708627 RepID=A0A7S0ZKH7_9RHOD